MNRGLWSCFPGSSGGTSGLCAAAAERREVMAAPCTARSGRESRTVSEPAGPALPPGREAPRKGRGHLPLRICGCCAGGETRGTPVTKPGSLFLQIPQETWRENKSDNTQPCLTGRPWLFKPHRKEGSTSRRKMEAQRSPVIFPKSHSQARGQSRSEPTEPCSVH